MKVLYVVAALAMHGGIERVLVDKLNWLVENSDLEVSLLTVNQGPHPIVFPLNSRVENHDLGIRFHHKYQYSGWKRIRMEHRMHKLFQQRLEEWIKKLSPHIIVFTRLDFVYDVMRVRGDIPVIYESHSSYLSYKFENKNWLHRLQSFFWHYAVRKTRMVVALTQGDALEWKKQTKNVTVIPNVVHQKSTGRISECSSKSVIFVGRYSYQKDIRTLLQIWDSVYQRHTDWHLHLYGDYGDEQEILVPQIKSMKKNIVVHEPTSTIFEEYLNGSMLLLTSRYEPFGLVLPEAMSCGLPVVAFDCPYGPMDIISDGIDGFLIKDRSIEEFANKICMLMESEDLRRKLGNAGVLSSQRYQASRIMPLWKNLFEQLCKN